MGSINQLGGRIDQIVDRVTDAEYIFSRKFDLVNDHIRSIKEKIKEDNQNKEQLEQIRQMEINFLTHEVENYFQNENRNREE